MFYFVFARTIDIMHGNSQLASSAYIVGPTPERLPPEAAMDIETQWRRFNTVIGARHFKNKINKAGCWPQ